MKKVICILSFIISISASCKAPQYSIGMDEQTFIRQNKAEVVKQTATESIYKKTNFPFGSAPITKFFYFANGKLVQVDSGRQPDLIIDKTIHNQ